MSALTAIRKQENPDGAEGHEERLRMQEESKSNPPKKVFTRGRDYHKYTIGGNPRRFPDKTMLLYAKWFCGHLCKNSNCPLMGV